MPATITANEKTLTDIFASDQYFFEIPRYQRPYVWTEEHVAVLLDDLKEAMGRDDGNPYFLGSIVIIKGEGSHSYVVDGQQRLTTLTMLLCVLRDLTDGDKPNELDEFIREKGSTLKKTEDRFRLSIRAQDRDFFQDFVQSTGGIEKLLLTDVHTDNDSQKNILTNVKLLHRDLANGLSEEQRSRLAEFICQSCYLVVVSTSDVGSAHRIFTVMNDRGLDLSPTDVLKSDILDAIPSDLEDAYATKWENIEIDLGRESFRDLFAHIRMIYRKEKQRMGNLQDEFRNAVLAEVSGQMFIDEVLDPYADIYSEVSRSAVEVSKNADTINNLLRHLNRLDNFDWIPPTLFYLQTQKGNQDGALQFIRDLERLAYGLFIKRANLNERISRYAQVLRAIEQDEDLYSQVSPLQLSQEEKQDIRTRLNGGIYDQPRIPMPLLLRLDSLLADEGATYDTKVTSIEHVLPRNPSPDSEWMERFPDAEQRANWVHRLANLVLLSRRKNTRASNWDFERKRNEYFSVNGATPFVLTSQVAKQTEWTPAVLEHRQEELVNAFKKEWRLD